MSEALGTARLSPCVPQKGRRARLSMRMVLFGAFGELAPPLILLSDRFAWSGLDLADRCGTIFSRKSPKAEPLPAVNCLLV